MRNIKRKPKRRREPRRGENEWPRCSKLQVFWSSIPCWNQRIRL
uniref:Uncharacterized protein n=1 Tax=Rhizophora mucronata TaxID=61149 RepID=A0A2P2KW49_RHIMU